MSKPPIGAGLGRELDGVARALTVGKTGVPVAAEVGWRPMIVESSTMLSSDLTPRDRVQVREDETGRLVIVSPSSEHRLTLDSGTWTIESEQRVVERRKTPGWAIVLAIVGIFFFLLGLLFLLVKETVRETHDVMVIRTERGQLELRSAGR